ncbi:ATP-dependent nuclease [Wenzhouxiangella sp. EGI_FJ10409]|uniref:ATP-dependent nuclease n=1 Tax=Wenzhouxiangella sp. EGI_FJ10409 TaxID=3243767 RepID=UPI0035E0189F
MTIPIKYNSAQAIHDGDAPLVIIGPNGSGKTRFGLQLAKWNDAETIAALRNIALAENIPMQSLTQAEQELTNHKQRHRQQPWNISSEINNLFAKLMAEDSASAIDFRDTYNEGVEPEITKLMRLQDSWERLFPGRRIVFKGYTPKVTSEYVAGEKEYAAQSMSDGERVALYLAGRVLDAKPGVIVVDEPEVHLHSRLAMQFWDELERLRSDCRFVYITHDLPFAQSRQASGYLIVKPGSNPQITPVEQGVPPDVSKEILAAASFSIYADTVVFCEGTESSVDQRVLRAYYNDRSIAVVPVGSCRDVIKCTAAFSDSAVVQGMKAIGIVDRDYWPNAFLDSLPSAVHVLPAHEIESLLCHKSIFLAVSEHIGNPNEQSEVLYGEFLNEAAAKFTGALRNKQVSERFKNRCTDQFNRALNALKVQESDAATRQNHEEELDPAKWATSPKNIMDAEATIIDDAVSNPTEHLVRVLPGKVYWPLLIGKLGLSKDAYIRLIVDALVAKDSSPLSSLGHNLREAMDELMPACHQGTPADPPSVSE